MRVIINLIVRISQGVYYMPDPDTCTVFTVNSSEKRLQQGYGNINAQGTLWQPMIQLDNPGMYVLILSGSNYLD